ncbi:MAG: hypothetical protein JWN76_3180 [Chitinophagaceae bacterium]|nr:hypothetical protein [Chitinophagaceae bacterium]
MIGIAVPVIIHLWNRRQGRTLKVGSILLLEESAKQSARSFKISEWLLLILRCLLIILLVLLLAGLFLKHTSSTGKQKGWILAERNNLTATYEHNKSLLDSLDKAGLEFHYFDENFPGAKLLDVIKDTSKIETNNLLPYWFLLSSLQEQIQPGTPVFLFTSNKLNRFAGNRPAIDFDLHWKVDNSTADSAVWMAEMYKTNADSLIKLTVHSTPAGNFVKQSASFQTEQNTADSSASNIHIYAGKNKSDAVYLLAAIQAIQQFTKRRIGITEYNSPAEVPIKNDVLFWLSPEMLPAHISAKKIFKYEAGNAASVNSWLVEKNITSSAGKIKIRQVIHPGLRKQNDINIWNDGYGNTFLSKDIGKPVYHFYTHLNPLWSDLTWSNDFPVLIMDLLFEEKNDVNPNDRRAIDIAQLQPAFTAKNKTKTVSIQQSTDLPKLLWLLAFLILVIERILSMRNKRSRYA